MNSREMAGVKIVRFTDNYTNRHATLHDAVRNGDILAVRDFLKNGRDVNETDSSGNTPLLLAVCIKQEEIYDAIVAALIENGADVNAYNKGFTPLYNAVFYKREKSVEMLLKAGAWLRPSYKNELHLLGESGGTKTLELILNDKRCTPEIINRPDDKGRTALHLAAQSSHKNCLRMLIEQGGDLAATDEDNDSVADIIFQQIVNPEIFITEILDDKICMKQLEQFKFSYNIAPVSQQRRSTALNIFLLDFSVLAPKKCGRQMEVISNMLVAASEEEKIEVLQHPLIELYLMLKWARICYFFYLWISVYFIFATSMGLYIMLMIHRVKNIEGFKTALKVIVIFTATGLLCHAVLQCILDRRKYFQRYEMWMNLICTCLSLTVAITLDDYSGNAGKTDTPNWVLHITSISILMAWIELMLLIGRLPSLGYYALMFSAVLQNVVKVLLAYVCLLVGFTLSFSVQFHNFPQFSDPWRALVKTTVMMMGEFEYGDMFAEDEDSPKILPATSRFIFLIFVILTSIVLMNLMVGVAVSDIQELHRRGRAKKLEKQAEFLHQLEKVISSKHLNSEYMPEIIKRVILKRSYIHNEFEVKSCAEFQRQNKIPKRIIDSITAIAKSHKQFKEEN
ncbi:transient receptor potential channel pyrexia-like isoform X2 [Diabrotica undecimpunctata]|uniref:transient receptor potential channel pyrexia-like isoform X2 n=1 Tax=Diabrotica undecimpunctata TaxID=50387 RepID=UPI003B633D19